MFGSLRVAYAICAIAITFFVRPSQAFDWEYGPDMIDLTYEATLGNASNFDTWAEDARTKFADIAARIPLNPTSGYTMGVWKEKAEFKFSKVDFQYREGVLAGRPLGGVLAIPDVVSPDKPVVIALHGHEFSQAGHPPEYLFDEGGWGGDLAKAGYIVWAPSTAFHEWVEPLAAEFDYPLIWAKFVDQSLKTISPELPAHSGFKTVGLALGGTVGFALDAVSDEIDGGVYGASFFSLEWSRREYRVWDHPMCWDIRNVFSYTTVVALHAPNPVQIQMGRDDAFFPRTIGWEPRADFSGFKRGNIADETFGGFRMLEAIWKKQGGTIEFVTHPGGHGDLDIQAAIAFLDRN